MVQGPPFTGPRFEVHDSSLTTHEPRLTVPYAYGVSQPCSHVSLNAVVWAAVDNIAHNAIVVKIRVQVNIGSPGAIMIDLACFRPA